MEHGKWSPVSFPAADFDKSARSQEETSSSWTLFADRTEYRVIQKVLDDCMNSEDGITCLKTKAISFLDRAARLDSIPLFTGVSLARQPEEVAEMPAISEAELETTLPRGWSHKNEKLDQMIYDRLSNFLANHTLVMDVSEQAVQEVETNAMSVRHSDPNDVLVTGRVRRRKKLMGFVLMALSAVAAMVGPLAFKSLAALAFKALLVAKVALVLSSVLALKKFVHHDDHNRSLSLTEKATEQAHRMAYNAHLWHTLTD
ncbi:uncharacterized protein LOC110841553 [Zootermopsis nevadensis]|uniref:uncharacterized protein LOC110841553 n=1 Tax=Zootermopsis nevadensis TaxID=136037 RepID=UPI000B8E4C1C|nr:uncharacterized protein LOC110841553 [Zootermopsis nevadensis]